MSMVYANDEWVQVPVMLLYDTGLMQLAVNNARYMYEKAEKRMDDFYEKYDNFYTPIQRDQDWYNENVIGRFRKGIDELYARGEDPLRTASGRAKLAALARSVDVGTVNKLRSSAKNAEEFLKARKTLEAQGLYNPMLAKYDGPDIGQYSTLDQGIWDKMSPTPYQNMADFSKSFFDNIQPFQRSATKNGIRYTISSIDMNDLHRIADAHFNDLVLTPQGQLMYKAFLDQNGGNADAARRNFNDAVVSGNIDRLRYSDNLDEQTYRMQNLAIKQQNLALRRQIAASRQARSTDNGAPGTQLQGVSLALAWYDTAMANAYSAGGITKDWDKMHTMYGDFGRDASKIFTDFGNKFRNDKINPTNQDLLSTTIRDTDRKTLQQALDTPKDRRNSNQNGVITVAINKWKEQNKPNLLNIRNAYKKQFTIGMDGKSVAEIIGTPLSENKMVARIGEGAIDKLYGEDDIISNTAGYTKAHTSKNTKQIRDAIKKWGAKNTTVTSMERGYGSLRKDTGSFEVNPEVKIVCTDDNGNVQFVGYGYYDIGLGSNKTKGGVYVGNYRTTGGAKDFGGFAKNPNMNIEDINTKIGVNVVDNMYRGPVNIGAQRVEGLTYTPEYSNQVTNMFPDYNRWNEFGVWDTDLTSKRLHAKASESLGTYGNVYESDLDNLLFDEED